MTSDVAASLGGERVPVAPGGGPPGPEELSHVSDKTVPGYRLGALLAAGRRGPVHRAQRGSDGADVTIHLIAATLDRAQRRRFRAETAGLLRLPPSAHLVPLLDAGVTTSGRPYLVTPPARTTLADRLPAGPMDVASVIRAGLDAAAGLGDLHRAGMLHGNLSPGNLVQLDDGAVAVTGFAVAVLDELDGGAAGPFAPPEILEGGDWTVAADVYALAGTLFALLTTTPPYERRDAADVLSRMRSGAVPEIRADGVPDRLRAALRRGLDPSPSARFGSAEELADALRRVPRAASERPSAPSGPPPQHPLPASRVETVPPQSEAAPPGRQFGSRYVVGDQIGEGSMGVVCRAVDTDDGQPVAVKLLKPPFTTDDGAVTRFLREGSALRRVAHPNLVRVRDFVAESGNFGLVMDLVEGEDLRTVMAAAPLTPAEACTVLGQVAGALGAVHAGGIVHRDVKPENVLVERGAGGCNARLADFGIARFAEGPTLTQPGMVLCTLAYAAPEMRSGAQASRRSDVYALGVVAYELFAGRRPTSGDNPLAPVPRPAKPPAMPDELWQVVRSCLDDDPARRPDADAVAPSLLAVAGMLGGLPALPRWGRTSSTRTPILASVREPTPAPVDAWTEVDGVGVGHRVSTATSERPPPAPPAPEVGPGRRGRMLIATVAAVILIGAVAGAAAAILGNRRQPATTDAAARTAYHQVPVEATAASPASGEVRLSFSGGGPDTVGYLIYRLGPDGAPVGGGDGELLDTGPLPGPSYEITGVEADARHCFRVTALRAGAPPPRPGPRSSPTAACVRADGGSSKADTR